MASKCDWEGPHYCGCHTALNGVGLSEEERKDKEWVYQRKLIGLQAEIAEIEDRIPTHSRLRECLIEFGKLLAENPDGE